MKRLQALLLSAILIFSLVFSACGGTTSESSINSIDSSVESSEESSTDSSEEIVATGKIYPFIDACEQGILSKEDIQAYANRNIGSNGLDLLSENLSIEIREAHAKYMREQPDTLFPNITADDLYIYSYQGTYNNCSIVRIQRKNEMWLGVDRPWDFEFYGIVLTFNLETLHHLVVYEKNS